MTGKYSNVIETGVKT